MNRFEHDYAETDFPLVPLALLEKLEGLTPNRAPFIEETEREIFINVGQVQVVNLLRRWYETQNRKGASEQ